MTSSPPGERSSAARFQLSLAGAMGGMWLLAWLSTGTLAAYAVGLDIALITEPCRYVVNCDHGHFLASFLMLDGAPREHWETSVVLRRTLYPLLSFPFMKVQGFEDGGLLANFGLASLALVGFTLYVRRRVGDRAAKVVALLVATYPGLHYWIGLPYSYAIIVPASLAAAALLWELQDERRPRRIAVLSAALGALYVGYDLAVFFGPAAVAVVWRQNRRPCTVAIALAMQLLPSIVNAAVLRYGFDVPLATDNTQVYWTVLTSYLQPGDLRAWATLLARAPYVLVHNFVASNFVWLPFLFVLTWTMGRRRGLRLQPFEVAVLLSTLAVWSFNNLAPPYPGKWQMRGDWIARLYQPVFAIFLTFIARFVESAAAEQDPLRRWSGRLVGGTAALNALVMLGPFVGATSYTAHVYAAFYAHAPPNSDYGRAPAEVMVERLQELGRRPVGFCGE